MKVNLRSDEQYARLARRQKEQIRDIAARIEAREPLNDMQTECAAAILRKKADDISEKQPRQRGQQPQFPSGKAALMVETYCLQGQSRRSAVAEVAERFNVSDEAIKKALKKDGAEARAILSYASVIMKKT